MPLYEYQCDDCGHRFERIQKFSDELVSVCPECEGVVRKLASSPAIQFKGTGWYVTDYARKPSGEQDGSSSKSDSSEKSETKSSDSSTKKESSDSSSTSSKESSGKSSSKSSSSAGE